MAKNFTNKVNVSGYIFSHNLTARTSRAGVDYINGTINVATDKDAMNVVAVSFTYVTEYWGKTTKPNTNYPILMDIINGNVKTYEQFGEDATTVRIDGNAGVNDFVSRQTGEVVSPKRVEGSFIHLNSNTFGAKFDIDVLLTGAFEREYEGQDSVVNLTGYTWNFRNDILPIDFSVRIPTGKDYFLGQDISKKNPLLTNVRGDIMSTVIENQVEIPSAFGDPIVRTTTRTIHGWDINWASPEPMEFDDDSTLTKSELKKMLDDREEVIADVKKRWEERQNGASGFSAPSVSTPVQPAPVKKKPVVVDVDDDEFDF